jgi:hypothetical protein
MIKSIFFNFFFGESSEDWNIRYNHFIKASIQTTTFKKDKIIRYILQTLLYYKKIDLIQKFFEEIKENNIMMEFDYIEKTLDYHHDCK